MSETNLIRGCKVIISASHNHLNKADDIIYQVAAIDRVHGLNMAQLTLNNSCVGVVPESKLSIVK